MAGRLALSVRSQHNNTMKALTILACCLLPLGTAFGGLYSHSYPEEKQPQVGLRQAIEIAEFLFSNIGLGKDYYAYLASVSGEKERTGAGAWTLMYRNPKGDKIQIEICFPDNKCVVAEIPKNGPYTEKLYLSNGMHLSKTIDLKFLKDEEVREKASDFTEPKNAKTDTEQAGADQPATMPADKPPVKDQPSTPTPKDLPR